jgi:rare lipoprotein A
MNVQQLSPASGMVKITIKRLLMLLSFSVCFALSCSTPPEAPPKPSPPGYPKPYKVWGKWYQPLPDADGFVQRGLASWYGKKFHGRKTSNGETYDMYALTAAHKTLPFNTYVKVKNVKSGQSVVLRINDRGPFVKGRIIDLSYTGAKKIGLVGPGVAAVELVALGISADGGQGALAEPAAYDTGEFTFQVGAFKDYRNAENLKQRLAHSFKNAHIVANDAEADTIYRVRVGKCFTMQEAKAFEKHLNQNGFTEVFLVAE